MLKLMSSSRRHLAAAALLIAISVLAACGAGGNSANGVSPVDAS